MKTLLSLVEKYLPEEKNTVNLHWYTERENTGFNSALTEVREALSKIPLEGLASEEKIKYILNMCQEYRPELLQQCTEDGSYYQSRFNKSRLAKAIKKELFN